jgi:hypothetical protein
LPDCVPELVGNPDDVTQTARRIE